MKTHTLLSLLLTCSLLSGCKTLNNAWGDISNFDLNSMQIESNSARQEAEIVSECPHVEIVDELSSLSEFSTQGSTNESQLISRVDLGQAESSCSFELGYVALNLKLAFEGELGPKAKARNSDRPLFSYPFFVAVTDEDKNILAKEVFGASISYNRKEDHHTYYESLRQLIPIKNQSDARDYRVLLGFQLTREQLAYNRAHMIPVPYEPQLSVKQPDQLDTKDTENTAPLNITPSMQ